MWDKRTCLITETLLNTEATISGIFVSLFEAQPFLSEDLSLRLLSCDKVLRNQGHFFIHNFRTSSFLTVTDQRFKGKWCRFRQRIVSLVPSQTELLFD
jgi:hypothetical protein